jgi:hypothetical protein
MAKAVAFSPLLLDTSCELHLPVVCWNISSRTIFAFRSPTITFSPVCVSVDMIFVLWDFPLSLTQSELPHACKSCRPNALLQQEHCICVIPVLIDYLWSERIPSSKIWFNGLITFPQLFKFSAQFPSSGFLTHIDFQGEVVGLSPALFCVSPTKSLRIVVQMIGVTDLPRDKEL